MDLELDIGSLPAKQGNSADKALKISDFAVLDLTLARIVNGGDPRPPDMKGCRNGAIAQLGERVVRNDEVGGSIPPGSTSLRRLGQPRLGRPLVAKVAAS